MPEIKWIKITTDIFDDEKIKLIDAMPERDTILVIWFKLLTLAGKSNGSGYLLFSDNIPYDEEMLSTLFNRPINSIRLAISTFKRFKMIILHRNQNSEEETFYIANWEKHQNIEGMEKIREKGRARFKRFYDNKKKLLNGSLISIPNVSTNVSQTQPNAIDIDIEVELELEKEEDKDKDKDKDKEIIKTNTLSGKPDPIVKDKKIKKELCTPEEIEKIKDIITYLNKTAFKKYSYETKETQKLLKPIIKNYTLEIIRAVITMKGNEWHGGEFERFLTPSTLFKADKFEKYYNSLPIELRGTDAE